MELRSKNGDVYKKSAMQSYGQFMQRHLLKKNNTQRWTFQEVKIAYKWMTKELKILGQANVEHYPTIPDVDMEKMYMFFCTDLESPKML